MIVLKAFLPKADLAILDENSQHNNLPRIGSDDNTAFPGGQINLAGAVAYNDCASEWNVRLNVYLLNDFPFREGPGSNGHIRPAARR
jgi:hypothetical protein